MIGAVSLALIAFISCVVTLAAFYKWREWNMLAHLFCSFAILLFYVGRIVDITNGDPHLEIFIALSRWTWATVLIVYIGGAVAELVTKKVEV